MNSLHYILDKLQLFIRSRSMVKLVSLVLLCFIVYFAIRLFMTVSSKIEQAEIERTAGGAVSTSLKTKPVDLAILSDFDPFYGDPQAKPQTKVEDAPETTLNLKVFGMRADLSGESSGAIIQTPDGKQNTYYIDDEIIPGVVLKRVDIDYVILDRNGVSERLSRQGKTLEDQKSAGTVNVSLDVLNYKASELIDDLRFYPYRRDGEVLGYRVSSRRGAQLDEYGFKRNDIITAINGQSLTQNIVNMPALWKNFRLARYATIDIIRDEKPMTIQVNLK